jgi:hypothetical protein
MDIAKSLSIPLLAILCAGCAVQGGGYALGGTDIGYGVRYFEPFDNSRSWGPGYLVGPPSNYRYSDGEQRSYRALPHPYRSAPPSKPLPSIPSIPSLPRAPVQSDRVAPSGMLPTGVLPSGVPAGIA